MHTLTRTRTHTHKHTYSQGSESTIIRSHTRTNDIPHAHARATQSSIKLTWETYPPDPIHNVSSLPDCLISRNYLTHRSVHKHSKSVPGDTMLQYLIFRTRLCGTGFIIPHEWVVHFRLTKMVRQKYFVPVGYQLPRGISAGPALKYFCMIDRGGRTCSVPTYILQDNPKQRILPRTLTLPPLHYLGVSACKLHDNGSRHWGESGVFLLSMTTQKRPI